MMGLINAKLNPVIFNRASRCGVRRRERFETVPYKDFGAPVNGVSQTQLASACAKPRHAGRRQGPF
jgi:hypothetical protein